MNTTPTTAADLIGIASKAAYLNAAAVGDGLRLTIDVVQIQTLSIPGGGDEEKPVVLFLDDPRGWVLNKTNITVLSAMFGPDIGQWHGKRLTLHNDERIVVKEKGRVKHKGAVRVKSSPDISKRLSVSAGGNAYKRALDYVIEVEADAMAEALSESGLTVAAYDHWAGQNGRPPMSEMPSSKREAAAAWIRGPGAAVILAATTEDAPEPEPPTEPQPEPDNGDPTDDGAAPAQYDGDGGWS